MLCQLVNGIKLIKSLNNASTFYPTHCEFQDLHTKRTFGGGCDPDGGYPSYRVLESLRLNDIVVWSIHHFPGLVFLMV